METNTRLGPRGRFRISTLLGTGGSGRVYEAHDRERDIRVALKVLECDREQAIERLENELRAIGHLVHPNLVDLYELVALDDEVPFLTMELVEGVDLVTSVFRSTATVPHVGGLADDVVATPAHAEAVRASAPASGPTIDQAALLDRRPFARPGRVEEVGKVSGRDRPGHRADRSQFVLARAGCSAM